MILFLFSIVSDTWTTYIQEYAKSNIDFVLMKYSVKHQ